MALHSYYRELNTVIGVFYYVEIVVGGVEIGEDVEIVVGRVEMKLVEIGNARSAWRFLILNHKFRNF